jgi:hypothetical protein
VNTFEIPYHDLKEYWEGLGLAPQVIRVGETYRVFVASGPITFYSIIPIETPRPNELDDLETNVIPIANNVIKQSFVSNPEDESRKSITDRQSSVLSYVGYSKDINALTSDPVWSVKRVYTNGTQTYSQYVDDGEFTQVWDDRNTLFTEDGFFNAMSLLFDGVNDYVSFGNVYNYTAAQQFSVSVWIKPNNFSIVRYFLGKADNAGTVYGWRLGLNTTGKVYTQMRTNGGAYAPDEWPTTLTAGVWTHLVWTYAGSNNKSGQSLYVNGVKEVFTPSGGSLVGMSSGTYPLTIGAAPLNYYSGHLDEFSIWDKVLSDAEVLEIYNSGAPNELSTLLFSSNLQSWWRLGDGDTYPVVLDQKGVANGTLTNMSEASIVGDVP